MKNPFVYGKEVSKENFCNRISEIKEITRDIKNSQNVLIFSQRRFGKTSLIKRIYEDLDKNEIIKIYVDLYPILAEEDFISIYTKAVSKVITGGLTDKLKELTGVFKRIRPVFTIDQEGQTAFSVDINSSEIKPMLEDVLDGFNRYVEEEKKPAVVCLDEFQQIGQLKTDRIEKYMRSKFQTHKNISYIFMGSKKHLIQDMFNNPNRPFYRSAKPFPLGKINKKELKAFIENKFAKGGKVIPGELTDKIIDECESHPYYVQYLCHIIWETAIDRKKITSRDLVKSLKSILLRESSTFEATWGLLTLKQKQVLTALSEIDVNDKIFSANFLQKHRLGSASSVQRTLKSLMGKDLIDRTEKLYSIIDIMFKKWIAAQSAGST